MDDPNKEIDQVKDTDTRGMAAAAAPKKTFFFKRGDGMIFPCEEKEAWDIVYNTSTWKRRDFTLLGTSDGTTFAKMIKESKSQAVKLEPEIANLKNDLDKYVRAEERLLVDEVVDMDGDPSDTFNEANKQKVLRLRKIMAGLKEKIKAKEKEYRETVKDVVKRATDAELAVALENTKKHGLEWPDENVNILTPDANPRQRRKILNIMDGRK